MNEPTQICRGFTDEQWRELRRRLIDHGKIQNDEAAWKCAVDVFARRIRERFLSCIEALINCDSKQNLEVAPGAPPDCSTLPKDDGKQVIVPGFAILALCCLLAETLQGFRQKPVQPPASAARCTFPEGQCIRPSTTNQFRDFLRRPAFRRAFDDDKIAAQFVKGIRNGIFHEAETRGWVVWREEPNGSILAQDGDGYALNRTEFYRALKEEFETYLAELQDPANSSLRCCFVKNMTDIEKEC